MTDADATAPRDFSLEVRRGHPTDAELAAVMAVVSEAYAVEADEATADDVTARSAWEISARALREPLRRDVRWGRFSG
ncbi:hypothetical protein FHX48_001758 [Microbacterium halimionae]|uniref:Acyl-CoA carboxylase epsilon subunit n=1 Tax=Microbacterium halimionae TaxID=1526413 RepID=A0A7W3JPL3_9MICO|nr:acyl-CoA carboxylase subunit epsilon [Microbacterium halimionae]MBA8816685.1 hypothetical protein [Microbacterium halimionae]NII95128.1 hypothetical protein [Microbacterium halimionae]